MISARYDLAEDIASFDFFSWLVMVAAKGASEIVFGVDRVKTTKWPLDVVKRRFESIIAPGPALLGLPSRTGDDGERMMHPHMRELVEFVRQGNTFPRLSSVLPPAYVRYTVTLRRDRRIPERNSNEIAWRKFAAEIGALVIEDYEVKPIGLHERMALYAGAEQNFGVPNGPLHLALLSDHPVMMFDCQKSAGGYAKCGMEFGSQCPWSGPHQRLIWEPDDLQVLRKHFAEWRNGHG